MEAPELMLTGEPSGGTSASNPAAGKRAAVIVWASLVPWKERKRTVNRVICQIVKPRPADE